MQFDICRQQRRSAGKNVRKLTYDEITECKALRAIFEAKKKGLGLTQEAAGVAMGISQSAVGHYLHGRNALNMQAAMKFASMLRVDLGDFSPRLARQAAEMGFVPIDNLQHVSSHSVTGALTGKIEHIHNKETRTIQVKSLAQIVNREQGDGTVAAPDGLPRQAVAYALENDSMEGPGRKYVPRDSTLYIIEGAAPEPGKVVLASLHGAEVIGEYSMFAGKPYLRPYNPQYPAVDISEAKIAGVLAGYYCSI